MKTIKIKKPIYMRLTEAIQKLRSESRTTEIVAFLPRSEFTATAANIRRREKQLSSVNSF